MVALALLILLGATATTAQTVTRVNVDALNKVMGAQTSSPVVGDPSRWPAAPPPVGTDVPVNTAEGPIVGVATEKRRLFLGIPFSAPPVGAGRWTPPKPITPWTTPLVTQTFKLPCAQAPSPGYEARPFYFAARTHLCIWPSISFF